MTKNFVFSLTALMFQSLTTHAYAQEIQEVTDPRYFEIVSGTLEILPDESTTLSGIQQIPPATTLPIFPVTPTQPGTGLPGYGTGPLPSDGGIGKINDIINLGERLWKIIVDNRPVVNVQNISANALPASLKNWEDMEDWEFPAKQKYRATYKNAFGGTVVDVTYRLQFTAGGSFEGKGKYLMNVTIVPETLTVAWGYGFDAQVQIGQVVNRGNKKAPLAGMEINVQWIIKTPLKETRENVGFFVQGDGKAMVR